MEKFYKEIKCCRICGSKRLKNILDLGTQALTGVFPLPSEEVRSSPVTVCKCDRCNLVQLRHTVDLELMYGNTYGYESSLNGSMIRHLESIAKEVPSLVDLKDGDLILDIGSNDATLLSFYDKDKYTLVGIDPTAVKFMDNYKGMTVIPKFFNKKSFREAFPSRKAKVITSIACFYDLESPVQFAKETAEILEDDGVWIIEMAYLPAIINNLCFDGYVQEHLEYYSLNDIKHIMDQCDLHIKDVQFNDVNGGSFRVTVAKDANKNSSPYWRLDSLLISESHLANMETHSFFEEDVVQFKQKFRGQLEDWKDKGLKVYGIGASTKFNVVLQYCGVDTSLITAIGEVNSYKFGRVTPGTNIPIIPEKEVLAEKPDVLVVGPYHFRSGFLKAFDSYVKDGGALYFPLPCLELVKG